MIAFFTGSRVYYCRKHHFVVLERRQMAHCLAQNFHRGCKNLITLPAKHPNPDKIRKTKRQRRRERQNYIPKGERHERSTQDFRD